MYKRNIEDKLLDQLNNKEIIILYGARQTGKTTLLNKMFENLPEAIVLNCERPQIKSILESKNLTQIKLLFGNNRVVALDEVQSVDEIGTILKIIYDSPEFNQKIIATGSSSFDLTSKVMEPLTGRNIKYRLFPLSFSEILEKKSWLWCAENLEELLLFGSYPGIIDRNISDKHSLIQNLSSDYLFKDILALENIKNPSVLRKILQSLAWQIGSQISYNELAGTVGVSMKTVEKYIDLLEKSFVIFSLSSFSRNLRNELKKSNKFYFYDLGIRNALINNFSPLSSRNDKGFIWENFCVSERLKFNEINNPNTNMYFWRTYDGGEIDLIEERNAIINAFEFKYSPNKKSRFPNSFIKTYEPISAETITTENYLEFLT